MIYIETICAYIYRQARYLKKPSKHSSISLLLTQLPPACGIHLRIFVRAERKSQEASRPNLLGISGIQLARALQKNSPLGGNASGSSKDPTQT